MANLENNSEREVKQWLQKILIKEDLVDFDVKLHENSAKGEGYLGDMVFVLLTGKTKSGSSTEYDLVLKCSKTNEAVRANSPVGQVFLNEMYMFENVFPTFARFQARKGIQGRDVFDAYPRYYGSVVMKNMEILALENLNTSGFSMWNSKKPMALDHVENVIKKYGKFHALSAALQDQQPEVFDKLVEGVLNVTAMFRGSGEQSKIRERQMFGRQIDKTHDMFQKAGDFDEEALRKWKNLADGISDVFDQVELNTRKGSKIFQVIAHKDCWNNNFMFKHDAKGNIEKAIIIDWQMAEFNSPIYDLAHFFHSSISEEDVHKMDDLLKLYHESFSEHVRRLGSDPEKLWSFSEFLQDWQSFARYGLIMAALVIKIGLTDKEERAAQLEDAEKTEELSNAFSFDLSASQNLVYKNRVKYLLKNALQHHIL